MMGTESEGIFEDLPIESAEEDVLERVEMAENLAKIIAASRPKKTSIVAVTGEWGSGKTSFLNLVSQALSKVQNHPNVTQIHFSPSYFQDAEDLILSLSKEIEPRPNCVLSCWRKVLAYVRFNALSIVLSVWIVSFLMMVVIIVLLARFRDFSPQVLVAFFAATVSVVAVSGSTSLARVSTRELIQDQENRLKMSRHRDSPSIVVFIDEIDRLDNPSICQLFRFIKVHTTLTGFLFVLVYDRRIVELALSGDHTSGGEYLEKLVQLEVQLPAINNVKLQQLIESEVQRLIKAMDADSLYHERRLNEFIAKVLVRHINTLRSLKRYCSTVLFVYPSMKGEVDILDFFAIMLLRVFYPNVYGEMRWYEKDLTGYEKDLTGADRSQKLDELIERFNVRVNAWVDGSAKNAENVFLVLRFAFPNLRRVDSLDSEMFGSEFCSRGDLCFPLVSNKRFFQRYFSLSLSPFEYSDTRIRAFIDLREKNVELELLLPTPVDTEDALLFVRRFVEIGLRSDENSVESLTAIFDYLTTNEANPTYVQVRSGSRYNNQFAAFGIAPAQAVEVLVVDMLTGTWGASPSVWSGWIGQVVSAVSSTSVAARIVDVIEYHGKGWDELGVNEDLRSSIVDRFFERVLFELEHGILWKSLNLSYILECVISFQTSSDSTLQRTIISKIRTHVENDEAFIEFLEHCRFSTKTSYLKALRGGSYQRTELWFSPIVIESVSEKEGAWNARLVRIGLSGSPELQDKAKALYQYLNE